MSAPVPTLVLLHGWGLLPRVWTELRQALPPDLMVLAPALPGHGDAPPAPGATLADWSDALLAALPEGAVLCGWSLGGLIALDLARRHPEMVSRLILIGSSPCFVSQSDCAPGGPWPHGLDAATVAGFIDGFAVDPAATLRRFVALQAIGDARRRAVAGELADAHARHDGRRADALADGLRVLAETNLRATLDTIRQPVRLLHGSGDALMPLAGAEWLAGQLPQGRLTVFDDCGHAPFLSRPAECGALIERELLD